MSILDLRLRPLYFWFVYISIVNSVPVTSVPTFRLYELSREPLTV